MVDFSKSPVFKLQEIAIANSIPAKECVENLFVDGEYCVKAFSSNRDSVLFTNKRIISINVQGLTGSKKDYTSMPYSRIQVYSVETAGSFDRDAELELCFSGLGQVKFEFTKGTNVSDLAKIISGYVLK